MSTRIYKPTLIDLFDLDIRLSVQGLRKLGTEVDNVITIGHVPKGISLQLPEGDDPFMIVNGEQNASLLIRNVEVDELGIVTANIVAMNPYTAFMLESGSFMICLKYKRSKDCLIVKSGCISKDFVW
ncbi:MAG: hypothetical protein ACRCX2_02855 [Paraclostridium sp.]